MVIAIYFLKLNVYLDGYGIDQIGFRFDDDKRPLKTILNEADYEYVDGTNNSNS